MRSPFPWNGSKIRLLDQLKPYIQMWAAESKGHWVEPFLGSGAVTRLVREISPETQMIVGDMNPWLMAGHQYWLTGQVAPPTIDDVSPEQIEKYRNMTDVDFETLTDRDRALRFFVCLYSAWGNRWATKSDGQFQTPLNVGRGESDPEYLLRRLQESYGTGWFNPGDIFRTGGWGDTAKLAVPLAPNQIK